MTYEVLIVINLPMTENVEFWKLIKDWPKPVVPAGISDRGLRCRHLSSTRKYFETKLHQKLFFEWLIYKRYFYT